MKFWRDITTDRISGHTVAKDWFKAASFIAGLLYLFLLLPFVLIVTTLFGEKKPVLLPTEVGLTLLGAGVSLQVLKETAKYFERKSADGNGQPLAQPGVTTPVNPGEMMPLPHNPNS